MNLDLIKDTLRKKIDRKIHVKVRGMRNRVEIYEGTLYKMYPNIFSIMTKNGEKSFSYADVATKEIILKFE